MLTLPSPMHFFFVSDHGRFPGSLCGIRYEDSTNHVPPAKIHSVWTVALTSQQRMERLAKNYNTRLEDFTYKSGAVTFSETFDRLGGFNLSGCR